MPRIAGIKERRDHAVYDTNLVEPGQVARFFGNAHIGLRHLTNLQVANQFTQDQTYVMLGVGLRCVGKTYEEEMLLLDHLHLRLEVGDKPMFEGVGQHLSMLRDVYTQEEADKLKKAYDDAEKFCQNGVTQHEYREFYAPRKLGPNEVYMDPTRIYGQHPYRDAGKFSEEDKIYLCKHCNHQMGTQPKYPPTRCVCYLLARPIVIPVRQCFRAEVSATKFIRETVAVRVHLFGLQTRDVA